MTAKYGINFYFHCQQWCWVEGRTPPPPPGGNPAISFQICRITLLYIFKSRSVLSCLYILNLDHLFDMLNILYITCANKWWWSRLILGFSYIKNWACSTFYEFFLRMPIISFFFICFWISCVSFVILICMYMYTKGQYVSTSHWQMALVPVFDLIHAHCLYYMLAFLIYFF